MSVQSAPITLRRRRRRPPIHIVAGIAIGVFAGWITPPSLSGLVVPAVFLLMLVGLAVWKVSR